jgi:PAS domain S-box-containing protein
LADSLKDDPTPERNHGEDALRASEARYRRLFETAQDGMLTLDAHSGLITDLNLFLIRLLDYPREDFLGKNTLGHRSIQANSRIEGSFSRTAGHDSVSARYWSRPPDRRDSACEVVEAARRLCRSPKPVALRVADAGSQRLPCGPEPQNLSLANTDWAGKLGICSRFLYPIFPAS